MSADVRGAVKQLKGHQQSQLSRLQLRAEAEIELLDNVNGYFRKRAEIEHQYAQSLEKLSKNYASKKFKRVITANSSQTPLTAPTDDNPVSALYTAFTTVLVESEKQARSRETIHERILAEIADFLGKFNKDKAVNIKRNIEFETKYQQELWAAYDELDKAKQFYDKAAKEADSARRKYDEISRKPGSGLSAIKNLVTGTDSEERIEKSRTKWKSLSRKLNDMRNDYLLALEAINVMQSVYYKNELPNLMKNLDDSLYSSYPVLMDKYASMEKEHTVALSGSVDAIKSTLPGINQDKETSLFMREHQTAFQDPGPFSFEPSSGDDVDRVTVDDVTKVALGQRLGRLIIQEEDLISTISQKERELSGVSQMADVYAQTPSFGNAASPLEQRHELENSIRLLNAIKSRLSSQAGMLKNLGVEPIRPVVALPALPMGQTTKANAFAVYDYDAKDSGETSIRDGDELLTKGPEANGWIQVQNLISQGIGLVPTNYIKMLEKSTASAPGLLVGSAASGLAASSVGSVTTAISAGSASSGGTRTVKALYDFNATDDGELSFAAGDTIEILDTGNDFTDEAWWEGRLSRTKETGQFPVVFTQGWQDVQMSGSISSLPRMPTVTATVVARTASVSDTSSVGRLSSVGGRASTITPKYTKARALYAYESTCEGELSMSVGDIITVTNKNTGSDAWWEGEGPLGKGQFPVNYVEAIDEPATLQPTASLPPTRTSTVHSAYTPPSQQVKALYDYSASEADEISFSAGDVIKLTSSSDPDWWQGELKGRAGAFPANYVQKI
ncbi:hypothetical protein DFS34DRAFT_613427 [Phlyctochytrium arcticum]|nr:hypothetical protein DFS34DRAFT_613427 [Phlyctochytrium arcticum]